MSKIQLEPSKTQTQSWMEGESHKDSGVLGILEQPWAYNLLVRLLYSDSKRQRYVDDFVKPFPSCKILDIGCGTGGILSYLPETVGHYVGFDMNPDYIAAAKKKWGNRGEFICQKVDEANPPESGYFDIILATSLLHHLDDEEASKLFEIARCGLRDGGHLVTYDNVFIENQHWFAKWMISNDRGKAVRTEDGYRNLALPYFPDTEVAIQHDCLRVPYTIIIMKCNK